MNAFKNFNKSIKYKKIDLIRFFFRIPIELFPIETQAEILEIPAPNKVKILQQLFYESG